ncbi:MAG: hypothetical protein RLY61_441 [Candidatus Parcubacteria bacterium]|jgi:hypothetical protein
MKKNPPVEIKKLDLKLGSTLENKNPSSPKFDIGASANKKGYSLNAGISLPITKNLSVGGSVFKGNEDGQKFGGKQFNATLTIPLNKKKKK